MAEIGYFLASEEHGPNALVDIAVRAEAAGFSKVWISDHYHPWIEAQGSSPFVWAVIGGISRASNLHVTTAVTCPTVRIHPAVVAHAAATATIMLDGRFSLGVGSGENLNEHILGTVWPETSVRLEMLEEAIEVMRSLWSGGFQSHRGRHYTVQNARIYDLPGSPPPVLVSGFGPKATELAGRVGDGYVTVMPNEEMIRMFKESGGEGKPVTAGLKVCWADDETEARRLAHKLWPNEGVPGELAQELPMPAHFEQASELVTEEHMGDSIACGPDPDRHVEAVKPFIQAGCDEIYISQMGDAQEGFFTFYEKELRPRLEKLL